MELTLQQKTDASYWLEGLHRPRLTLSAWELGFLASVADQFERNGKLSERQLETLKKLYEEKA